MTLLGTEIVFEVREDEVDGGYSASAIGFGIHTQGDTVEKIRENVQEAFECYFDGESARPEVVRLHFPHGEVLVI
ncbi:type II toxin-antitoxin system HicB family antitoxin [Candidatus Poriferisocius sp.]|uniref:type II toxin-antitoxin system HicB family antitoxin n=1 Tax=Candidatus Poriferisocius sp. TaxID=3101276 RepID=UPI003B5236A5